MRMAGYGRVSTDEEKQLDSLENQKEFFAEFARMRGYKLFKLYADEGISGKQLKKRDEFLRMMNDAELRLFDIVVVKDVSRFARNTVDLLTSIRKLKSLGIEVVFVNNNQKILGESEFVITLLGAMAQEESANLSKRVKFGKQINSKKGRVPPKIYGYDRIDNFTLVINPEESAVVKKIFDLYIDNGDGARKIAIALEEQGEKTKLGGAWNSRGIRRILENSIYCGKYYNHKYSVVDFLEGTQKKLPPEEFFFHERPEWAIISEERFQEAQDIIAQRQQIYKNEYTHKNGRYSNRHLFSTIIRCADCGRSFSRRSVTYKNTYVYWRCPTNNEYTAHRCSNNIIIREDELKRKIESYLSSIVENKDAFIARLMEKVKSYDIQTYDQAISQEVVETRKKRLQTQREKYQDMYANDLITMEELKKKLLKIQDEIEALGTSLENHIRNAAKREDAKSSICAFFNGMSESSISLDDMSNADLRRIISMISVSHSGEVEIHLKVLETIGV